MRINRADDHVIKLNSAKPIRTVSLLSVVVVAAVEVVIVVVVTVVVAIVVVEVVYSYVS